MKRIVLAAMLPILALSLPLNSAAQPAAQPAKKKLTALNKWFRHWRAALKKKSIEGRYRSGLSVTSVAAVRGGPVSEADPKLPYWKGSWSDKKKAERLREREEQAKAIDLILEGKYEEAGKALDAFEKDHPKSSYLSAIKEARANLKELESISEPAANPSPEKKAEKDEEAKMEEKAPETVEMEQ